MENVCRLAHLPVHCVCTPCASVGVWECVCVYVCAALKMENPEAGTLCCHFTQNPCDARAPSSSRRVLVHRFSIPSRLFRWKRITFNLNGRKIIVNSDVHVIISQQQVVHTAIRRSSARSCVVFSKPSHAVTHGSITVTIHFSVFQQTHTVIFDKCGHRSS